MILSILIPSTYDRTLMREALIWKLKEQIFELKAEVKVEIITMIDNRGDKPTGTKRNELLSMAKGRWVVFVDDDDEVSDNYVREILFATKNDPDVINFRGWMTTDGNNRENFTIREGLLYVTVQDGKGKNHYLRHTNHLSVIKKDIAKQIGFKDIFTFEDHDYAVRLKKAKLISTEVFIDQDLYHYKYIKNKK